MASVNRAQRTIDSEYQYMDGLLEDRFVVAWMTIMAVLVGTLNSARTVNLYCSNPLTVVMSNQVELEVEQESF